MQLLVVGYPAVGDRDARWIYSLQDDGRLEHSTLPPHFTFVFPVSTIEENELRRHVRAQAQGYGTISFALRSSLIAKDDSIERYYVLLVPDEGFGRIVKLHDRLYSGLLAPALRLDIAFIPHITIGYAEDAQPCKAIVDSLNSKAFEIQGEIPRLDIVMKEADAFHSLEQIELD